MKIIKPTIFISNFLIALLVLVFSCSKSEDNNEQVESDKTTITKQKPDTTLRRIKWVTEFLEYRDELLYVKNEIEPYTGITFGNYKSGNLRSEFNWVKGILNGPATKYYENGMKESMAMHVNGYVEGLEIEWWENGNKRKESTIKDGQVEGRVTQWKENGELFQTYRVKPVNDSSDAKN